MTVADAAAQSIEFAPYENVTIPVTMQPASSIAGLTFALNFRFAGVMVAGFPLNTFAVIDQNNGIFSFTLNSALTGTFTPGETYDWDVWRTTAGQEAQLAYGQASCRLEWWK